MIGEKYNNSLLDQWINGPLYDTNFYILIPYLPVPKGLTLTAVYDKAVTDEI